MSQNTLYEITRRSILITKNEETSLSWNNSLLTVRTEKGINFFELLYDLESSDKKIDWVETSIGCPKTSPASNLFPTRYLKSEIRNIDMIQMIIDPALWPHNPQLMNEMANITAAEWSPPGFIPNNKCVIATLNNVGNVEIFRLKRNTWLSMFNLSSFIKKPSIKKDKFPENLMELKTVVDTVESSAICWSGNMNSDGSCYFVTAQRNSDIILWSLKYCETEIKYELIDTIHSSISEIISMVFISKQKSQFLLICSNILGQIYVLNCEFEHKKVNLRQSSPLWPHKDRMIAKYMQYTILADKIILVSNKHRHLLVQMFDENCKPLLEYVKNINDYRITSITKNKDEFYVGTVDTKVYNVKLTITDTHLDVQLNLLDFKDSYSNYELNGFCFSENNLICVLGLIDRKIQHRKNQTKIEIVCLCRESCHQNEILMLLNNPTKKLTNMYDCIELLRYKTMKLKALPTIDYVILYAEANQDLYKLKVYLIIVILYNTLDKIINNSSKGLLPETSVEKIREIISVAHAVNIINELCETFQSNGNRLNNFQMEIFDGAKKYLLYYCQKNKLNFSEFISVDKVNILNPDIKYMCQCCNETINGFSCKNKHLNMFCSLTFTPISSDKYLVCKYCKITARSELYAENPMCIYCDSYLNFCFE